MLKCGSKRRRTAAQLAELKEEDLRKEERAANLEQKNRELQDQLAVQQEKAQIAQANEDLLGRFYAQGQLKKNEKGEWEVVPGADKGNFQQAKVSKSKKAEDDD